MDQFTFNQHFKVGASFGGILEYKVREAISNYYADKKFISLEEKISGDENKELQDISGYIGIENSMHSEGVDIRYSLTDKIKNVLNEIDEAIENDPQLKLMGRCWLLILFRKPKNKH
jgi:hypothetical protein